jgi:hypothetical protein
MNLVSWLTSDLTDEDKKKIQESGGGYKDPTEPDMGPLTDAGQGMTNIAEAGRKPEYVKLRSNLDDVTQIDMGQATESGLGSTVLNAWDVFRDMGNKFKNWVGAGVKSPEEMRDQQAKIEQYMKEHPGDTEGLFKYAKSLDEARKTNNKFTEEIKAGNEKFETAQKELTGENRVQRFDQLYESVYKKDVEKFKAMSKEEQAKVVALMPKEAPVLPNPDGSFNNAAEAKLYSQWKQGEELKANMKDKQSREYKNLGKTLADYDKEVKSLQDELASRQGPAAVGGTIGTIGGNILKYATIAKLLGTTELPDLASKAVTGSKYLESAPTLVKGLASTGTRAFINSLGNMAETTVGFGGEEAEGQSLGEAYKNDIIYGSAFPVAGDILNTSRILRGGMKNFEKASRSGNNIIAEGAGAVTDLARLNQTQRNLNMMQFLGANDAQIEGAKKTLRALGMNEGEINAALETVMSKQDNSLAGLRQGADDMTNIAGQAKKRLVDFTLPAPTPGSRAAIETANGPRMLSAPTQAFRDSIAEDITGGTRVATPEQAREIASRGGSVNGLDIFNPENANSNQLRTPARNTMGNGGDRDLLAKEIGSSKAKQSELDAWMWKNKEAAQELNSINSEALNINGKSARSKFIKNATEEIRAKYINQFVEETGGATAELSKSTQIKALQEAGVSTEGLDKASPSKVQDIYETALKDGRMKNVDLEAIQPSAEEVAGVASKSEAQGIRGFINDMLEERFNAGEINSVDDLRYFLEDEINQDALARSAAIDPEGHGKFMKKLADTAKGLVKFNKDQANISRDAWKDSPFYDLMKKDSRIRKTMRELDENVEPTFFGRSGSKSAIDEFAQQFADEYHIGDGSVTSFLEELDAWRMSQPAKIATGTQKEAAKMFQNMNAFGAIGGVETDENGNVKFNAKNAALGLVVGNVAPKLMDDLKGKNLDNAVDAIFDGVSKSVDGKSISAALDGNPLLKSIIGEMYGEGKLPEQVAEAVKKSGVEIPKAGITNTVDEVLSGTEKGLSKLGKDIEKKMGLALGETADYDIIHVKDQAKMAADLVESSSSDQLMMMLDNPNMIPDNIRGASLWAAVSQKAQETGDAKLAMKLATSSLTSETSRHAQELRMMAEIDPTDPVAALKRVLNSRAKATSKYLKDLPLTDEESKRVLDLSGVAKEKLTQLDGLDAKDFSDEAEELRLAYGRAQIEMNNYVKLLQDPKLDMNMVDTLKNTDWMDKVKHPLTSIKEIGGVMKSLTASLDDSGIFRPGLKSLVVQPKEWLSAVKKSWEDIFMTFKKNGLNPLDELDAWIVSRPKYLDGTYKKAGLAVEVVEEAFPSSLPEKLPGVAGKAFQASEAAFTGLQKRLRISAFDNFLDQAERNFADGGGEVTKEAMKKMGKMANSLTGRGDLGKFEMAADWFNNVFFSARNLKANIDTLTDVRHTGTMAKNMIKGGPRDSALDLAKEIAAKNTLKIIGSVGAVLGTVAVINPDAVDLDPRSADFGKIKIGNTRFDITAGMGSILTLAARTVVPSPDSEGNWGIGRTKSSTTGLVSTLNSGEFGAPTIEDTLVNYTGNKLSPLFGIARDLWLRGEKFGGGKPNVGEVLVGSITPFPIKNAMQAGEDPNSAPWLLSMIADGLGIAVNTYGAASEIEPGSVYNLLDKTDNPEESKTVIETMKKRGATDDQIKALLEQYYTENAQKEIKGDPSKNQKPNPRYKTDKKAKAERVRMLENLLR